MILQRVRAARARGGLVAACLAALLVAATFVVAGAQAAAGCQVTYTVGAQWPGGFTANVQTTNLGDPVDGWKVAWTFPSDQQVTQAWNATVTSLGAQVVATNPSWAPSIETGATASFGFNGSWSGSNMAPASFTLNGAVCTGIVKEPPTPSPSGTPTASPSLTGSPSTSPSPTVSPATSPPPTGSPAPSSQPGTAMETVAAMQPGWNLGNTLDAIPDETAWGNPMTTRALLHHVRSQGYNSIRIPVTWTNHHGPDPDYTIDPAWLSRVRQIVDWSLDEGFYVMINLHHDSWQWINTYPSDPANVTARYAALWTQLSTTFRDYSAKLVFESNNEPQFAGTSGDAEGDQINNELNTRFVRLVRESGGNNRTRLLVLPTLNTNAEQARLDALGTTFDSLDDPNLAATVHFYGYWPFSVNIAGGTRYDSAAEQDLLGTFDRVHDTFVARGIPVIVGEWALLNWDYNRPGIIETGEFLKFIEAVGYQARTRNVTTMVWDAGQFLNRNDLTWRDPDIFAMMEASWTTRSGTASSDQIYLPRSGTVPSRMLTLNPNGATFRGLWHGNTQLAEGSDYSVSGTTLTLSSPALIRLAGNRSYGTNSTIEARFSAGVPWVINIITADPPTQTAAAGTTASLAIPTQFRGDQLATMEATYADGTSAGPANWTPFKEFWTHFQPDYTASTITLNPEFFAEVNDGQVNLRFHFWSGTEISYTITKAGTTVTGTSS